MTQPVHHIVEERRDSRIRHWYYDGLDYLGCHWHPSLDDHRLIADQLTAFLDDLPPRW